MRKQNRNITVKPGNFTKEELLGFTSKAFQLEQSEYVAKKIIDQLLFLTFDKVRKINVQKMECDYSYYSTMQNIKQIVSLGLIQPEIEYEKQINYIIDFDIKPSKIDTWASNHAKILTSVPPEEVPVCPVKKANVSTKGEKEKSDKSPPVTGRGTNKSRIKETNKKKGKGNLAPRELPIEALPIKEEVVEQLDELEQMKLKGYRIFFQEKEIERQKRKQLEKEQEERAKEEEKKIKQVMQIINSSSLVSWDSEGRFLPLKPINPAQMKNFPEPNMGVSDMKYIYDPEKLYDLTSDGKQKTKFTTEVYKEEPPAMEVKPRYYQPDPLVAMHLEKGTNLEFYGKKKTGGDIGDDNFDLIPEEN